MPIIKVGQPAPNATLQTLAGESIDLAPIWGNGQPAWLIFLRHLA